LPGLMDCPGFFKEEVKTERPFTAIVAWQVWWNWCILSEYKIACLFSLQSIWAIVFFLI
jgi:hypothetical protein